MNATDDKKIFIEAADVYAAIGNGWPEMLDQMGIEPEYLRNKHGPCPACGGKDRYRFDNRRGRGDFYCNGCGAGDGFALLQRTHGWTFGETLNALAESLGLQSTNSGKTDIPVRRKVSSRDQQVARSGDMAERHTKAAARAERLWQKTGEPNPEHPYLIGKAIDPHGIRQLGRLLVVPMRDDDGKLWSLQFIAPKPDAEGKDKKYMKDSRTKGMFHIIGERTPRIWLVEGFATGCSLHADTGECVVAAFTCHNLLAVARVVKSWKPQRIAVMADDDWQTDGNPGIRAAKGVSEKLGCDWFQPEFPPGRATKDTDYNDAARLWATRDAA